MKKKTAKIAQPLKPKPHFSVFRYSNLIFIILIILAGIVSYSNSFTVPFQFDDYVNFVNQQSNHDLSHFGNLTTWIHATNRPLSNFSLALNYHFNGFETNNYHVINLLFHVLTGLVLFLLIFQLTNFFMKDDKTSRSWFAFLVSLVFVLHPIQTQAVTYIVQRMSVMAALFYLLSIYLYGEGRIKHIDMGISKKTCLLYALSFISFILALESKENAATLPVVLLLYEICFIRDKQNKPFLKYIISFGAILVLIGTAIVISGHIPKQTDLITRGQYFLTQIRVIVQYLKLLVLPIGLNIDHDVKLSSSFFALPVIISTIILLVLLDMSYHLYKKHRIISFAILWFFITLAVESSIIPISDVMVEHRLYLPLVGFAIALVYAAKYILGKNHQSYYQYGILLIVILYGGLTIHRNHIWQSEEGLWTDTISKSPNKARPHRMLADVYLKQERFSDARQEYKKAIQIEPKNPEFYVNYGYSLEKSGDLSSAKKAYLQSLAILPNQSMVYVNLGNIAQQQYEFVQAASFYKKALQLKPDFQEASLGLAAAFDKMGDHQAAQALYGNSNSASYDASLRLGMSLLEQGNYPNAISSLEKAIQLEPTKAEAYYQLGRVYLSKHQMSKAADYWKKALSFDHDYYMAYNDLGTAAYMSQLFKLSIDYWEKSLKINANQASIYAMIGSSYYQMGDKQKLIEYYKKAADLGYAPAKEALKKQFMED